MYSLVACVTFLFSPLVMCKWFCMEIWSLLCCFWGDCNTRGRLLRSLPRFVILAVVSTVIGFQGHGLVKYGHNYLHFKAQTFSSVSSVCFKKNFTWQNAGLILWTWSVQCCWKLTKKKKERTFFWWPMLYLSNLRPIKRSLECLYTDNYIYGYCSTVAASIQTRVICCLFISCTFISLPNHLTVVRMLRFAKPFWVKIRSRDLGLLNFLFQKEML